MGEILRFEIAGKEVSCGSKKRTRVTRNERGCNEPFKDWFWCPKQKWFMRAQCPFANFHECESYKRMCGVR